MIYRALIQKREAGRVLYLAVPVEAFKTWFDSSDGQFLIQLCDLKLLVYDPQGKEDLQWIEPANNAKL